jgi:hypothetical protein
MVPPNTKPIYRLVHISNLSICLQRGGMHAPNHVPNDGLVYRTIHSEGIQQHRHQRAVPCGPGGTIHDYVSFYFGPHSPMLLQLCTNQVAGYNDGPTPIIYLVATVQSVVNANVAYVFTDGHGVPVYTQWYDDVVHLDSVDWNVVGAKYWNDTVEDPDRKRRKQAEFMVHEFLPWALVNEIGVYDRDVKTSVESILTKYDATTPVIVRRQWYY